MRALIPLLLCSSALAAQAVERADVSRPGQLRVTFDPTITIWDREYTPAGRVPIGASLPATLFVHAERRITPLTAELGLTDRVSLQLFLPLVRAMVRARLPADSAGAALDSLLADTTYGFAPVGNTLNRLRYFAGDFEIAAKLRLAGRAAAAGDAGAPYAATLAAVVRLPTGHLSSPNDLFAISSGDHQTDLEGRLTQELTVAGHLWLNLSIRAARQLAGTRARRVGPEDVLLLPRATLATLAWKPGNYAAVDFAPLLRLHRFFGAGPTLSYFTKQRDRYTFLSAQDSTALAARLGAPRSASVLDAGTSQRRLRLGWAMSYLGPGLEAGMSVEQTVSGAGGRVPATTVFRLVLRTWRKVF
jgi:hypothetical protein